MAEGHKTILMTKLTESKMVHKEKLTPSQWAGSLRGIRQGLVLGCWGGLVLSAPRSLLCVQRQESLPVWCSPVPDGLQALGFRWREPFWKAHRETLKSRATLQSVAKNIIKIPNAHLGLRVEEDSRTRQANCRL